MIRIAAVLALLPFLLPGCGSSPEETRSDEVLERVTFLFEQYSLAYGKQDMRALDVLRGDLRRVNSEASEIVRAWLLTSDPRLQGYGAFTLGFSGNRASVPLLVTATAAADDTVRINAIVALGNLGATETPMEPFRAMLAETNPDLRQAALFGLGMLVTDQNDRGMIDAIHKALGDPDVNVRNDAVILVRKMRRKESIPLLVPALLKDPEPLVRQNAALALGMMGKDAEGVTPYLIELLKDESNKAVEAAWRALNKIHDKDFDRSYATWRDWYEDELKQHWTCVEHKDVSLPVPGECPKCKRKLERMHKPEPRKFADSGPVPPAGPSSGTGLYVCPDHAEIQTTTPAKCGKANCGKELIPKKADAVIYSCPDHADVLTSTPAKCGRPGCGKDLVPKK